MQGPAYPIIRRIRVPRGPHRLRDRRWPPVAATDAAVEANKSEEQSSSQSATADPSEANPPAAPALPAGAPESVLPQIVEGLWEERRQSLSVVSIAASPTVENTVSQHSEQSPVPNSDALNF